MEGESHPYCRSWEEQQREGFGSSGLSLSGGGHRRPRQLRPLSSLPRERGLLLDPPLLQVTHGAALTSSGKKKA